MTKHTNNGDGGGLATKVSRGNPRCAKPTHNDTFMGVDGFERCKDCRREYYRKYAATHPEYIKDKRKYAVKYQSTPEYQARERLKNRARSQANFHKDKLIMDSCLNCGSTDDLHLHHLDYNEPLNVLTLCRDCHEAEHHPEVTV